MFLNLLEGEAFEILEVVFQQFFWNGWYYFEKLIWSCLEREFLEGEFLKMNGILL